MPEPIKVSGAAVDLSPRLFRTDTVAASPSAAAETVIATLTINEDIAIQEGVVLMGFGATTQGASGTGYTLRIRRTDTSGTVIKSTGIIPLAAGVLGSNFLCGTDASLPITVGQVYVLTALHTAAAATSTYSAVALIAIAV